MPNYAEMTLMWSPVTTAMNKIVKGSATPEVALKEAQADGDRQHRQAAQGPLGRGRAAPA